MSTATITAKGQITIPSAVRARMRIKPGDRVAFIEVAPGRFEIAVPIHSVKALKGMFRHGGELVSINEMNDAIKSRSARRVGQNRR